MHAKEHFEPLTFEASRIFDDRGWFLKTFNSLEFKDIGIDFTVMETFFSYSVKNTLRGMHFQKPPMAQAKLVSCLMGSIIDVLVDLRRSSPTFRSAFSFQLTDQNSLVLYIPIGFAHGFYVTSDSALVSYQTTSPYDPSKDDGILWRSIPYDWEIVDQPIMSSRDRKFSTLEEFDSPF